MSDTLTDINLEDIPTEPKDPLVHLVWEMTDPKALCGHTAHAARTGGGEVASGAHRPGVRRVRP